MKRRWLIGIYALLMAGNGVAWLWAYALFGSHPVLIGTATLAYMLGMRHAVDADHLAAIDNVTRKFVQQGRDSNTVGLYFSLGHSTVVALACAAIAATAARIPAHFALLRELGGLFGTVVSASFLLIIAMINAAGIATIWRSSEFRTGQGIGTLTGVLGHILRPLVAVIASPWQMYPVGFLFGLGFDTASEIGLLSVSASAASHGLSFWIIMVFPALFTAGMALVDTTDGVLMKGAYGWALIEPQRKLIYNITITLFSILVAVVVAGLEVLDLVAGRLAWTGIIWRWIDDLNGHLGAIGCAMTFIILACWLASRLRSRHSVVAAGTALRQQDRK